MSKIDVIGTNELLKLCCVESCVFLALGRRGDSVILRIALDELCLCFKALLEIEGSMILVRCALCRTCGIKLISYRLKLTLGLLIVLLKLLFGEGGNLSVLEKLVSLVDESRALGYRAYRSVSRLDVFSNGGLISAISFKKLLVAGLDIGRLIV